MDLSHEEIGKNDTPSVIHLEHIERTFGKDVDRCRCARG